MNERCSKSLLFFDTPRGQQVVMHMDRLLVWCLWLYVPALLLVTWWFGKESFLELSSGALAAALIPTLVCLGKPGSF